MSGQVDATDSSDASGGAASPEPTGRLTRWRARANEIGPGVAVAFTVAAAANYVTATYGGPVMLMALLLGIALNFLSTETRCGPGITFTSKRILRVAVALLGLRIAVDDVVALGGSMVILVIAGVALTIATGIVLARVLKCSTTFGVLAGGATAICGASAALALSAALPQGKGHQNQTIFTVVAVTTLSTIAMVLYPGIGVSFGLDPHAIGIFLGATIHDVAQVVGAGYAVSEDTGDTATIVKLFRVALLMPVVLAVSMIYARERGQDSGRLPIPGFAIAFAILVGINSAGILPEWLQESLVTASRWGLVAAVAAIGLTTSLKEIIKVGVRPMAVIGGSTIVLLVFVLATLVILSP